MYAYIYSRYFIKPKTFLSFIHDKMREKMKGRKPCLPQQGLGTVIDLCKTLFRFSQISPFPEAVNPEEIILSSEEQ